MRIDISKVISKPNIESALEKLVGKKRVSMLLIYKDAGKPGSRERYTLAPAGPQAYGNRSGKFHATPIKKHSAIFDEKNVDIILDEVKEGEFSVRAKTSKK
jgi:hypothetical protein